MLVAGGSKAYEGRILWSFLRKSIVDLRHIDDIILEVGDTCAADAAARFSYDILIGQAHNCGPLTCWIGDEKFTAYCSSSRSLYKSSRGKIVDGCGHVPAKRSLFDLHVAGSWSKDNQQIQFVFQFQGISPVVSISESILSIRRSHCNRESVHVYSQVKVTTSDTRDVMPNQSAVEFRRKSFKLSPVTKTATITSIRQDAVLQVSETGRRIAGNP
jgi:hypothetical protein